MKKGIEIVNPPKILPWIGGPFMAAWILEGVILLIGFTPYLLFVNYLAEGLFVFLFAYSYKKKYEGYKKEPNLAVTRYFWVELGIHILFIAAATVQSALNVWVSIDDSGLHYRHAYFFFSLLILLLHIVFMCIDYYATEKAAIIRYCNRVKRENATKPRKK